MLWKTNNHHDGKYSHMSEATKHSLHRYRASALKLLTSVLVLLSLVLSPPRAYANTDDQKKAVTIKADNSQYDERAGTQTLSGNVEITQGSMLIKADSIIIELSDGALYRITGKGNPIRFQQLTRDNDLMRGQSNEIIYDTRTSEITFKGNAEFERPGQKLTGSSIEYNMLKLTFKAAGSKKGRVSIILQPGKATP